MGTVGSRAEGKAENVFGKFKAAVGRLFGNRRMEAEGRATELKGEAREESVKAGERAKGKFEEAKGEIKKGIGDVVGSDHLRAEGSLNEIEGTERQHLNR